MKKMSLLLVTVLTILLVLPTNVFAYTSKGLRETLAEEQITEAFTSYEETSDQAIIYLFRGAGCSHCYEFLEFLNSITEEYGKYFKLVAYEVWYNQENSTLMQDVASYLGTTASGVPFIVIGDKSHAGYASSMADQIKQEIKDLYNTNKDKRYDVIKQMNEKPDYSTAVIIGAVVVVGGIVALAVYARRNNQDDE